MKKSDKAIKMMDVCGSRLVKKSSGYAICEAAEGCLMLDWFY